MKKTVLTYGLISGGIICLSAAITLPLCLDGHRTIDLRTSELIGYSSMVVAFLAVFFGIRSYRERHGQGAITFGRKMKFQPRSCAR